MGIKSENPSGNIISELIVQFYAHNSALCESFDLKKINCNPDDFLINHVKVTVQDVLQLQDVFFVAFNQEMPCILYVST